MHTIANALPDIQNALKSNNMLSRRVYSERFLMTKAKEASVNDLYFGYHLYNRMTDDILYSKVGEYEKLVNFYNNLYIVHGARNTRNNLENYPNQDVVTDKFIDDIYTGKLSAQQAIKKLNYKPPSINTRPSRYNKQKDSSPQANDRFSREATPDNSILKPVTEEQVATAVVRPTDSKPDQEMDSNNVVDTKIIKHNEAALEEISTASVNDDKVEITTQEVSSPKRATAPIEQIEKNTDEHITDKSNSASPVDNTPIINKPVEEETPEIRQPTQKDIDSEKLEDSNEIENEVTDKVSALPTIANNKDDAVIEIPSTREQSIVSVDSHEPISPTAVHETINKNNIAAETSQLEENHDGLVEPTEPTKSNGPIEVNGIDGKEGQENIIDTNPTTILDSAAPLNETTDKLPPTQHGGNQTELTEENMPKPSSSIVEKTNNDAFTVADRHDTAAATDIHDAVVPETENIHTPSANGEYTSTEEPVQHKRTHDTEDILEDSQPIAKRAKLTDTNEHTTTPSEIPQDNNHNDSLQNPPDIEQSALEYNENDDFDVDEESSSGELLSSSPPSTPNSELSEGDGEASDLSEDENGQPQISGSHEMNIPSLHDNDVDNGAERLPKALKRMNELARKYGLFD